MIGCSSMVRLAVISMVCLGLVLATTGLHVSAPRSPSSVDIVPPAAGPHRPHRRARRFFTAAHLAVSINASSAAVDSCGAVGDGVADASSAVQQCVRQTEAGGRLSFPPGHWLVTETIFVNVSGGGFDLGGTGWSSNVLWAADSHLFQWVGMAHQLTLHDLAITSVGQSKSPGSTAIRFTAGVQDSVISKVLIIGTGAVAGGQHTTTAAGGGFDLGVMTLTVDLTDCEVWTASGFGVKVGHGAEVRIGGGRFEGKNTSTGIGVHLTGGNGGVHLTTSDVGLWHIGLLSNQSDPKQHSNVAPGGSNRELFLTQATLDSCNIGMQVIDPVYVCLAACVSIYINVVTDDGFSIAPFCRSSTRPTSRSLGCGLHPPTLQIYTSLHPAAATAAAGPPPHRKPKTPPRWQSRVGPCSTPVLESTESRPLAVRVLASCSRLAC